MDLFDDYQQTAQDLYAELAEHDEPTPLAKKLEKNLDNLGELLGLCDLDPVADDLIDLAYSGLARTAAARRDDSRRRYKGVCVRPEKRLAIFLRDEFTCAYCGKDLHDVPSTQITLDHVNPYSKSKSNDPSNLVTTCRSCNSARQDKPLHKFVDEPTRHQVRNLRRRSYKRYHGLAKAMLAMSFRVHDIRKSREYLKWM
jgi:hypothetical protein